MRKFLLFLVLSFYSFASFGQVAPITGPNTLCETDMITLSDATPGGTWSSTTTTVAVIGSSSGVVQGVSAGTTVITYNAGSTGFATYTITVNPVPAPISAGSVFVMCQGSSMTISDATPGGSWQSSNTSVATIGSSSGFITAVSVGMSVISYILPTGCYATTPVFVNPNPSTITGPTTLCVGTTVTLSSSPSGGTWSSSTPAIADVGSTSGIVTGYSAGTSTITYTLPTGCAATITVTVNPIPGPILGPTSVCVGSSVTLSNATPGGTWSTANTTIASVGSSSGVVTGLTLGGATITYTSALGCQVIFYIKVIPGPGPITGPNNLCVGSTITLSNGTPGGTWVSSDVTVATVGSGTGVVYGAGAGTATITYATTIGCYVTYNITVNPLPAPITGPNIVCVGNTITLSSATPGGTWSSSNTSFATVGLTTGVVTGVAQGAVAITYMMPTGCFVVYKVKVDANPVISGPTSVCTGNTIILTSSITGGTWSSSNTAIATISPSGVVTGITSGVVTITYTTLSGCTGTYTIAVIPSPPTITGNTTICVGQTTTLSNSSLGGAWSSSNTAVATVAIMGGVVTGISPGTVVITYSASTGCYATIVVTVTPNPGPITGPTSVCTGGTITMSIATPGGTWSSSNTAMATIGSSSGVVTGVSTGFTIITYMLPSGCYVTQGVKVLPPVAPITGPLSMCVGGSVTLSNATPGGTWSSSNTLVATVSISGTVNGIAAGTSMIDYTTGSGCVATAVVTVNPNPGPIAGPTTVCVGQTITLTNGLSGGTWSSGNTAVATVGITSGIVTGVSAGFTTITYTLPSGCFTVTTIKVSPAPCNVGVTIVEPGSIEIFPNPAYDELTIMADAVLYRSYAITNGIGQVVARNDISSETTKVDIRHLSAGMYYIVVNGAHGPVARKFIKQ